MQAEKNKTVIIIAGPTAVGKTAIAIEVAKHFHAEIISADSRQCFKELKIGVARPSPKELSAIPHHFIASHSIHEEITAAGFEKYALAKAEELFRKSDAVVMVGGTGLYIKAFCEGLDSIPAIQPAIRDAIYANYEKLGMEWLQETVKEKDPVFFQSGEWQNPQRMMRALEVLEQTGQSIIHFQKGEKAKRNFNILKIGLDLPREELYGRINQRVDTMIAEGLVNEAKELLAYKKLNALQTVGYAEIFDCLDGNISLEQAIELIKQNTRRYAKRQLTWFRRDADMQWFAPEADKIISFFTT